MRTRTPDYGALGKDDLRALCDRLSAGEPGAVDDSVAFFEVETFGLWHGRARAMMARRLKHVPLSSPQRERLVRAVLGRLTRGQFSEGFRDQLRLALALAPERAFAEARACRGAAAEHVRRFADWVLTHERRGRAEPRAPDRGDGG